MKINKMKILPSRDYNMEFTFTGDWSAYYKY